jgi:catechol 2,3-dioxygenase-like lactoylglutathione lyase family enzyme
MKITGIGWAGVRTEQHDEVVRFCAEVLGITATHQGDDFTAFALEDGSTFEILGPGYAGKEHMTTGPVVGFVVTDLPGAVAELRAAGVELLGESGPSWQHFRGPDGNVYELTVPGAGQPGT